MGRTPELYHLPDEAYTINKKPTKKAIADAYKKILS